MKKKLLCLALALAMLLSLVACGNKNEPADTNNPDTPPADTNTGDDAPAEPAGFQPLTYDEDEIYEAAFGEFLDAYDEAKAATDLSTRWALMGVAEAKLLESGVIRPGVTSGANYQMRRTPTRFATSVLYGSDSSRMYHYISVAPDERILADEIAEMNAKWAELCGTGQWEEWAKNYLKEKGYHLKDTMTYHYSADPNTWDVLASSKTVDMDCLINTLCGLMEYDLEGIQQPSLATDYTISDDGTVYTFHLRDDVVWVDSQGREVAKLTADDFVAGMQHLCDAKGGLEALLSGVILNLAEYCSNEINDFSLVGVKAVDDYTVEYTLCEPVPYVMTMLGYSVFFPLCRSYYESMGGKFGADYDPTADDYNYGKGPDSIVYDGAYLVTNWTRNNTIVFQANPTFFDADKVNTKTLTWLYNDYTDPLRVYNEFMSGIIDFGGLNTNAVVKAREDGTFDGYARIGGLTAGTWFNAFNLARRGFANFNNENAMVSTQAHESVDEVLANGSSAIEDDAARTHVAVNNKHFRLAFNFAVDMAGINSQAVGDELKYGRLRNTYVPGNFVSLQEEATIDINGTPTTFPAGTYYGEVIQAQLDADGFGVTVWDESTGSEDPSAGFDGWYRPDLAVKELEIAIEELKAQGLEISPEKPIYVDLPIIGSDTASVNQGNVYKQSVESVLGGNVIVNLVLSASSDELNDATYLPETGAEYNMDVTMLNFGWSPDWGDPNNYLDQMLTDGYMIKSFGLY